MCVGFVVFSIAAILWSENKMTKARYCNDVLEGPFGVTTFIIEGSRFYRHLRLPYQGRYHCKLALKLAFEPMRHWDALSRAFSSECQHYGKFHDPSKHQVGCLINAKLCSQA
jgi:hypothetical protein